MVVVVVVPGPLGVVVVVTGGGTPVTGVWEAGKAPVGAVE